MDGSSHYFRLMLYAICAIGTAGFAQDFPDTSIPDSDDQHESFGSSEGNGDEWTIKEGNSGPLEGEPQPDESVLSQLQVRWLPVEIDELGELATIRGVLTVKPLQDSQPATPVSWQQGLTVAIRNQPTTQDVTFETMVLTRDLSSTETCLTKSDGTFQTKIRLDELSRDKSEVQHFNAVIALAKHRNRASFGPVIVWSSADKPLKQTYAILEFPANSPIDPVCELLRIACVNDFDSLAIMKAVNALQPLGKKAALERIDAFMKMKEKINPYADTEMNALFWILRVLFEPIELGERIPPPHAFVRHVDRSVEADWPLSPIVAIGDIPFRFIGGGMGGSGQPEHPRSHLQFVKSHCVIRDRPLHPSGDPILLAQQLIDSPLLSRMPEDDRKHAVSNIREQAAKLLPKELRERWKDPTKDKAWIEILTDAAAAPLQWHSEYGFQKVNAK